jgi:hypothetical protein
MIGFDTDLSNFYHFMVKIVISLLSTRNILKVLLWLFFLSIFYLKIY